EQSGDLRTALAGVREARSCLELLLEVEGQLERAPTVTVNVGTVLVEVQQVILNALAPYPEARLAVAAALQGGGVVLE
ncbi:MAG: hypothetical protein M9950_07105, partial [Thermomicrobiales bacterium]|nr:hypothetical protein [Thermomicrobiales bacterium]